MHTSDFKIRTESQDLPVSSEWTAKVYMKMLQILKTDGGFDVYKENPEGDSGQTHASLFTERNTRAKKTKSK